MVTDDAVGGACFDHVVGHVAFAGIDKLADHLAVSVQLGYRVELVLVEEPLGKYAIDLFAYPPVLAVDRVSFL